MVLLPPSPESRDLSTPHHTPQYTCCANTLTSGLIQRKHLGWSDEGQWVSQLESMRAESALSVDVHSYTTVSSKQGTREKMKDLGFGEGGYLQTLLH